MSSFSGLNTALSSLIAQRQALDVAGQNIANANTVGYTRQRATLASVEALAAPSLFSAGLHTGNGVTVTGIARLGDLFLDARVRSESGGAAYAATRAKAYGRLESTVAEPGDLGVSNTLQEFWAAWEEVGNSPADPAMREVLIQGATALTERIAASHAAVTTQWAQARTELDGAIMDVNSSAAMVADLNQVIRGVVVSGGSANELIDQRSLLITGLSALVGASSVQRADGTVDVMVGGNALVRGDKATTIAAGTSSHVFGQTVSLTWANGYPLGASSGSLAGMITVLAPADAATHKGGILAEAGARYDALATTLITQVNAQHALALTPTGAPGGAIFASTPDAAGTGFSAANLTVALTNQAQIAVGRPGGGSKDGSLADAMAQLGTSSTGPDARWTEFVANLGVSSRAATQRATSAEATRSTAEGLQLSNSTVDIDEEAVNMLTYQRAYEGAARVLTAIDSMLDTLINRTGLVGR